MTKDLVKCTRFRPHLIYSCKPEREKVAKKKKKKRREKGGATKLS